MILKNLLKDINYELLSGDLDVTINSLKMDSRKVSEGDVFICIKGYIVDGCDYIDDAIENGAKVLIVEDDVYRKGVRIVKVEDTKYALVFLSSRYFDYPSKKMNIIGITGTSGKTTTSFMIKSILEEAGYKIGLIGTIGIYIGNEFIKSKNTTPDSYTINYYLDMMYKSGCEFVIMEVSSQALMLKRVEAIDFDIAVFTNLGLDHISDNEHKDFNEYKYFKSLLFKQCKIGIGNLDDAYYGDMFHDAKCLKKTFGRRKDADISFDNIKIYNDYMTFDLYLDDRNRVKINMLGIFNIYNYVSAVSVAKVFNISNEIVFNALSRVKIIGRMEDISISSKFKIILDYAHNGLSLHNILEDLKKMNPKRIITLFGCGGNRDKNRRFDMGRVSGKLSDLTIVTSDNPRFEEPEDIMDDIIKGLKEVSGKYISIIDRKEAIEYAIKNAKEGDVIIIAGKGHERYQEIKGVKYPMDDRDIVNNISDLLRK